MNRERYQQVCAVFDAVLRGEPADRDALLAEACKADPALRAEVERLLAADADARRESFLDVPTDGVPVPPSRPIIEGPGDRVGPYKILQPLGEGGMGAVFLAEQGEPVRRRVALKLIKPGMDSAQVIARFAAERQALALMDHPNIARVLDAGATESGRPYFVMELVKGVPITQYCDRNRLTTRRRLELLIPVCRAIQHAHQKGIIHRDIKPSNVLVTLLDGEPVAKVIDFGVAKAIDQRLTEQTICTQTGAAVGTLEYMSPEQAELSALDVDTRSDVYSLGVLMYELLTGTTPLERHKLREAGYVEIVRRIREEEPPKPSTRLSGSGDRRASIAACRGIEPARLSKLLRGELDWIAMKALEKDRTRRYATANGLARDIERYLEGTAVEAGPPSAGYQLSKFARRHRVALATAAAFALVLVAAAAVSSYLAVRTSHALAETNEAKTKAELALKDSEKSRTRAEAAHSAEMRALVEARANSARLLLDRGQALAEQGEVDKGLLLIAESVRSAPEEHPELRSLGRANLAAWEEEAPILRTIVEHEDTVIGIAFRPDGRTILTGSRDRTARLWNAATGQPVGRPMRHGAEVHAVAFAPECKTIVTGSFDGTARLWDAATGQPIGQPMRHAGEVHAVAFAPDGKLVATGSFDRTARFWDAATGQPSGRPLSHGGLVLSLAFAPDGKTVVTGSNDGTAQRWSVATREPIGGPLTYPGTFHGVAFAPDGKTIATGGLNDMAQLCDAATGQPIGPRLPHPEGVAAVAFAPDGKTVATAGTDQKARFWDVATGRPIGPALTHPGGACGVAFAPDGKTVATAGYDKTARIWAVPQPFSPRRPGEGSFARVSGRKFEVLAFSPDRARVVVGGEGLARLYDTASGQPIGVPMHHRWPRIRAVAFSPDGGRIATASHDRTFEEGGSTGTTCQVWDASTGRPVSPQLPHRNWVSALAFTPDGESLVTGSYNGVVLIWDARTGARRGAPLVQLSIVFSLAVSPDGRFLAAGTANDGSNQASDVQLWDLATGTRHGDTIRFGDRVTRLVFNADGTRLIAGSNDGTARLIDVGTGRPIGEWLRHDQGIHEMAFQPGGALVLTGSGAARLWDTRTGHPASPMILCPGYLSTLAFHPDGRSFAIGHGDGSVLRWDVATAKPIGPSRNLRDAVLGVTFSLDGRSLIAVDVRGDFRTWPIAGPVDGPAERLAKRIQARTGLKLDDDQEIVHLDPETWRRLARDQPSDLGATPEPARDLAWHDVAARDAEAVGLGFTARWHLDRLIAARPDDALLRARRARAAVIDGRTDQAVADESRALELGPRDRILDWLVQEAEDMRFAARFDAALRLLDRVLGDRPRDWGLHAARAEVLGGLGNRRAREAELVQAVELGADVEFQVQLAQERAEAKQWSRAAPIYRRLRERFRNNPATLRELDRILVPRLPAVIRGDEKPDDADEALAFAYLAYQNKQFGPSARLFAGAFRADPRLAEDMTAQNRYDAACAAVLAASVPSPIEREGTHWRKQALDWLGADLAHWTKQARSGTPQAKATTKRVLDRWKVDTDLAAIRDEDSLKRLPQEEREACRSLWAEVDALLKTAGSR